MIDHPIVDAHVHINAMADARYPYDPMDGALPPYFPGRHKTVEQLVADMDAAGVQRAALVQFSSIHGVRDNSYVADSAPRWSERFGAVCALDALASDVGAQADHWLKRGAIGLRLAGRTHYVGTEYLLAPAIWEHLSAREVPLKVYFGRSFPGALGCQTVAPMLRRFPKQRVVIDHAGNLDWTQSLQPLLDLAHFNVVVLFSGFTLARMAEAKVDPAPILNRVVATFGADRVMWGSDIPNTPGDYPFALAAIRAAMRDLSPEQQSWILGRTAQRVYPPLAVF